jgi:hypothetical protein
MREERGKGEEAFGTYLLHVDAVACAAENEACSHGFCEASSLVGGC